MSHRRAGRKVGGPRHGPCTACAGTRMPIVTDGFAQLGWRTAGHRRVRHTELLPGITR